MENAQDLIAAIRDYWNAHIHDLEITTFPPGTEGFFGELEAYRYGKLDYLPDYVNFPAFSGRSVLEIGCGVGIDLMQFARAGANVTGVDLSNTAIELARENFQVNGHAADLHLMNGEALDFPEAHFDHVFAHGVLQYTADAGKMVGEIHRVLKPGGTGILMVYNRISWLRLVSRLTRVPLEHEDAPVYRTYSIREFRQLMSLFSRIEITPERFPVKTQLHQGWKAVLFNEIFVRGFNLLPRGWIRPLGWHLVATVQK